MLNNDIKELYIQSRNIGKDGQRMLHDLCNAEELYNKELCCMNRSEAIRAVELVGGYDLQTINNLLSCGKLYAKWCYDNGHFVGDNYGILTISASNINPEEYIRKYIYRSEEELLSSIRPIIPIYDGYVEVVASIFLWLGISSPELIRDSDVSLETREIKDGNGCVISGFSDLIYDFLKQYQHLRESTRENGNGVYRVIKDQSQDTFIKQFYSPNSNRFGERITSHTIKSAIYRLNKRFKENGNLSRITVMNIMKSGSLCRLYEAEKSGLNVFSRENEKTVESYFYRVGYRSIVWLYRHYKQAFNL